MGRICVALTLAAIGAGIAAHFTRGTGYSWIAGAAGAGLFGTGSLVFRQHSVAFLGGLIGATIFVQVFASMGLHGWPLLVATILVFGCIAAMCSSSEETVVILITSFEGAVLLLAGLVPIVAAWPPLFRFLESTSRSSTIFFPFLLLVPTMIGYFLQHADSRSHCSGAA